MPYVFEENTENTEKKEFDKVWVPDDTYEAKLLDVTHYVRQRDQADRLRWKFEITGKKGNTAEVVGFTSVKFGANKEKGQIATGRTWVAAILGIEDPYGSVPNDTALVINQRCRVLTKTLVDNGVKSSIVEKVLTAAPEDDSDINF